MNKNFVIKVAVDKYLELKAQQRGLEEMEKQLKEQLVSFKQDELLGTVGRVVVSHSAGRTSYDADMLKKHVPAATLSLCTKQGADFITLKTYGA